jgi:outer membrane beta-barrel protein
MLRTMLIGVVLSVPMSQAALAQDSGVNAVDLGVLQNSELHVVQKMLYSKEGKTEVSISAGLIPFDPYTTAPKVELTFGKHLSESLGWAVQLGLGYGLKSRAYRELDSAAYGKVPEAYRYLGSITAGVQLSPIYAKLAWQGEKIYHHDIYIPIVAGLTVERLAEPQLAETSLEAFAFGPTVGAGVGARVFLPSGQMIRVEARDDIVVQRRQASDSWRIKQNFGIYVGISLFLGS